MAKAIRLRDDIEPATLTARGTGHLPGWYGLSVTELEPGRLRARMTVRPEMLAPNGFLHAASVVALADTSAGYATVAHLPDGATSFTTLELKSNFTIWSLRISRSGSYDGPEYGTGNPVPAQSGDAVLAFLDTAASAVTNTAYPSYTP